ncbi:serine/threonine protein kinase, partial [Streptomyces daliensis]|nr:serine/threonine protein kinase [Streptomyces daliensis]
HGGCSYGGSRAYSSSAWRGSVRSWSSCDSPGHSLREIGLTSKKKGVPQVYVQIRCDADCAERTDAVLRSLKVSGS